MSLTVQNGSLVLRNGALGTGQACCCGEDDQPCSGPCDEENPCPEGCICCNGECIPAIGCDDPLEGCQPICGWPKYLENCEENGAEGCGQLACVLSWDTVTMPGKECEERYTFSAPVQASQPVSGQVPNLSGGGIDCPGTGSIGGSDVTGVNPGFGVNGLDWTPCEFRNMTIPGFSGTTSCECESSDQNCDFVIWNATYSCSSWNCENQCCDGIEVDLFFEVPDGLNCDCPENFAVENVVLTCS